MNAARLDEVAPQMAAAAGPADDVAAATNWTCLITRHPKPSVRHGMSVRGKRRGSRRRFRLC